MRLYAHVMPVCSIYAPAMSGVILELWPMAYGGGDRCAQGSSGET